MERTHNTHHALWERRHYKNNLYRTLRNHRGLVIPNVWIPTHRLLHAELSEPPKPSHNLAAEMLDNLDRPLRNKFDGLQYTIEHLTDHKDQTARRLALHMTRQLGILAIGVGNEIPEIHDTRDSVLSQQ